MSKIIISQKILGSEFLAAIEKNIELIAYEKKIDADPIFKELAKSLETKKITEFLSIIKFYFGNELKIIF